MTLSAADMKQRLMDSGIAENALLQVRTFVGPGITLLNCGFAVVKEERFARVVPVLRVTFPHGATVTLSAEQEEPQHTRLNLTKQQLEVIQEIAAQL